MPETLLSVEDLSTVIDTAAGEARPVDRVSFEVRAGETCALLGESGCGKTLTALSVLRLLPEGGRIAGGRVHFRGRDLLALPEREMRGVRGAGLAMIFQEPMSSLNPVMSIGEQIGEVLAAHRGFTGAAARDEAAALLAKVGIPDPTRRLREYPFQLSGGLRQRAMIAMALAGDPRVLIADEPTTALDVTIQAQVLDLLAGLQAERGMGLLLITHDLGVVARMAHRVAVMYAGEIVEDAARADFFATPRHPYTRKLFDSLPQATRRGRPLAAIAGTVPPATARFAGCRFAERCAYTQERCRTEVPELRSMDGGGWVRCHFAEALPAPETTVEVAAAPVAGAAARGALLDVRDLRVHFPVKKGVLQRTVGWVKAVDGVSLSVGAGETVALVGESGCGKTTVAKAVLKLIPATGGQTVLDGEDVSALPEAGFRRHRRAAQIVFQDPYSSLDPRMRVAEIIEEGMSALRVGADGAGHAARIAEVAAQVGLPEGSLSRYPHEFSGGQRQRIAIARALAVEPRLIVCDEPTSALDVSVQAQILNLLKSLQDARGISYLFITHNLAVVDYLAHRVAVMYLGRIVESGPVESVLARPLHPYTRALIAAVPTIEGAAREVIRLAGDPPSPTNPPTGCHFHPRCPHAIDLCRTGYPEARDFGEGRTVACHRAGDLGD